MLSLVWCDVLWGYLATIPGSKQYSLPWQHSGTPKTKSSRQSFIHEKLVALFSGLLRNFVSGICTTRHKKHAEAFCQTFRKLQCTQCRTKAVAYWVPVLCWCITTHNHMLHTRPAHLILLGQSALSAEWFPSIYAPQEIFGGLKFCRLWHKGEHPEMIYVIGSKIL